MNWHRLTSEAPLQIDKQEALLRITRRWYTPIHSAFLLFSLVWNGVAFFFFEYFNTPLVPNGLLVLPALSLFVGGAMTYYSLAGILNRTVVRISNNRLTVKHSPLLCITSGNFHPQTINQLFVVEKSIGRWAWPHDKLYDLMVLFEDGRVERFMGNFTRATTAKHLEHCIENFLSIRNRPMQGEVLEEETTTQ